MKQISLKTACKRLLADVFTPVGIYLRLRDRFRDTVLLESTDHHVSDNSYSFIGINAIAGMEIRDTSMLEYKLPGEHPVRLPLDGKMNVPDMIWSFMQRFDIEKGSTREAKYAQGFYGYSTFDSVQFFESIKLNSRSKQSGSSSSAIPLMRYRLYQYVIVINHYKDELFICENKMNGVDSEIELIESLIRSKDVPVFPFTASGEESSNMDDESYREMVREGIAHCHRGDVFQIVLSRRFQQSFTGDEFNVYRALRSVNPSPYLFFFDYGDYKLMGSSPESQLVINNGQAIVHPIAGTFRRTGDDATDEASAERLLNDAKENAEHVMLVDLARNDLSRVCDDVKVKHYRQVQYYSHVIHLVSEVVGKSRPAANPFKMFANTFPAGTLSGAPKFKAMELIDSLEPTARSYYGGGI
ncbi:MAG TPA: anthranilate synthase component I family protein, partial [Flavitalea sp.]|nr:anthranilate synthase component I family protein [Flavitalea sp.]